MRIELRGSQALQDTYLSKLVRGDWTGTMNLTEPQAGSDLAAVRTRAVPTDDGRYLLTGQKIFITYGEHDLTDNIVHLVLARIAGAPDGVKGMSLFVVPKFLVNADGSAGARNDVHCVSIEHKLGIHGSPTCVLAFGQNGGAVGELVGEENRGLEYMFIMMNAARYSVGIEGVGLSERAYQTALAYARERIQGTEAGLRGGARVAIIRHPDVRRMLLLMKSQTEAMRALAGVAAVSLDAARLHPNAEERARHQAFADLMIPVDQGLVHRKFGRHRLRGHPGAWRRRIRRGDGRRAVSARCPHHADLRGHHRHSSQRSDRPQTGPRRRSRRAGGDRADADAGRQNCRRAEFVRCRAGIFRGRRCVGAGDSLRGAELRRRYSRRVRGRRAAAQIVRHRCRRLAAAAFGGDRAEAARRVHGERRRCRLLRGKDLDGAVLRGSCAVAGTGTLARHRPRCAQLRLAEGAL